MRAENRVSLERLSNFCDVCGFFCVAIGMVIIFIDMLERNMLHIQVGIYILVSGYAFVKIAHRIARILMLERSND